MQTAWIYTPQEAPFLLGIEKGFFAAEGFTLDYIEGKGSAAGMQLMAAKKPDFGFIDLSTAARFISEGVNVKAVWAYLRSSPMGLIAHADAKVKTLKDLEGKKVGTSVGDAGRVLFPALAKIQGVDIAKINFVMVTPAARNTSLINRDVDAIIAFWADNSALIRSKGTHVTSFRYSDLGVNPLGQGLLAYPEDLQARPDRVRRLTRAMTRTLAYTLDHRDEAVEALRKRAPMSVADPKVAREVLDSVLTMIHSPNTRGKPLGWMAREDWAHTVKIWTEYGGLKNPLPPESYYTNDFVPPDVR